MDGWCVYRDDVCGGMVYGGMVCRGMCVWRDGVWRDVCKVMFVGMCGMLYHPPHPGAHQSSS